MDQAKRIFLCPVKEVVCGLAMRQRAFDFALLARINKIIVLSLAKFEITFYLPFNMIN